MMLLVGDLRRRKKQCVIIFVVLNLFRFLYALIFMHEYSSSQHIH